MDIMNYYNIKQCAWCKRVKNIDTGIWGEIADMPLDVSHTICPLCKEVFLKNWNIIIKKIKVECEILRE